MDDVELSENEDKFKDKVKMGMRLGMGSETMTEGADFLMAARQNKESGGWVGTK